MPLPGSSSGSGKIYAWYEDGSTVPGFPITLTHPVNVASLAVGDLLPGTPGLEIVSAGQGGLVHCHNSSGQELSGWPKTLTTVTGLKSSPLLIDIDGDNALEVVVASSDSNIYAWESDGTAVNSLNFSGQSNLNATPAAADVDGDGLIELVYADMLGNLYCKDLNAIASDKPAVPSLTADPSYLNDGPVNDRDRDLIPTHKSVNGFKAFTTGRRMIRTETEKACCLSGSPAPVLRMLRMVSP